LFCTPLEPLSCATHSTHNFTTPTHHHITRQLALALRAEVAALEAAGCRVVQVDEPALREGLPLKAAKRDSYLGWAVAAFRLCTAVAAPATQVVTHLCYSDFDDIMAAIIDMDGAAFCCFECACWLLFLIEGSLLFAGGDD
jgi:methionine synthase II (cobalamin-independent)